MQIAETYIILGTIIITLIIVILSILFARYFKLYKNVVNEKNTLEQTLDTLPVEIINFDKKTSSYSLNALAEQLLRVKYHDLKKLARNPHNIENETFWKIVSEGKLIEKVKVDYKLDESNRVLLVSQFETNTGKTLQFIDITSEEEREEEVKQSEKLVVLGGLAARAAHEIRNPLAVVYGFLNVLKQESNANEWQLSLMIKELDRMNAIVEDMLSMAKPGNPQLKETFIEDILSEIVPLYNHSSGTMNIQFNLDIKRVPLKLDPRQITQVLYNLIRNSCEAMDGTGQITIETCIKDDQYCLFIKDTGAGIPVEIEKNIFDPFLTSKETGTGLGLPIVQRILEDHNGTIELFSNSKEGATFLITLPLDYYNR